jgi:hypothetical protein
MKALIPAMAAAGVPLRALSFPARSPCRQFCGVAAMRAKLGGSFNGLIARPIHQDDL